MTNKKVITTLVETNNPDYQLDKALEELSELQTALLQYKNKPTKEGRVQAVIDEIGDVEIRMQILKKVFGEKQCEKRFKKKINKFKKYLKQEKYIGKI